MSEKHFDQKKTQTVSSMEELLSYRPTILGQKIYISNCDLWYNTKEENDGKGGKRMCWVPFKPRK